MKIRFAWKLKNTRRNLISNSYVLIRRKYNRIKQSQEGLNSVGFSIVQISCTIWLSQTNFLASGLVTCIHGFHELQLFFPPCSLPLIKSKKMPFWLTFFFFTIFYLDFIYTVFIPNYLLLMQHTSISPDRKLMTVVGDHLDGLLVDPQNGKVHTWFLKIVVNYSDQIEIYFIIYLCTCCWSVSVCLSLV